MEAESCMVLDSVDSVDLEHEETTVIDLEKKVSTDTIIASTQNDFDDFKLFTHNSLAELRSEIDDIKNANKCETKPCYIIEYKDTIIQLYKEEIGFLRQENLDLRNIIRRNQSDVTTSKNTPSYDSIINVLQQQLNDKKKIIETFCSSLCLIKIN